MDIRLSKEQIDLLASVCQAHAIDVPGAGDIVASIAAAGAGLGPGERATVTLDDAQWELAIIATQVDTTRITDGVRGLSSELQRVVQLGGSPPDPEPPGADPDMQSPAAA